MLPTSKLSENNTTDDPNKPSCAPLGGMSFMGKNTQVHSICATSSRRLRETAVRVSWTAWKFHVHRLDFSRSTVLCKLHILHSHWIVSGSGLANSVEGTNLGMLLSLLDHFLGTDNALRQYAEREFQNMKALISMVAVLEDSTNEGHRALVAVLLRGIILREPALLNNLGDDDIHVFRTKLLACMMTEPVRHVQRKLAHTVAALAKEGDWPELLNGLPAMAASSNPKEQQLVFFLIDKLAEYIGPFLLENIGVVWDMISPFVVASATPAENVPLETRVQAVSALVSLLHEAPPDTLTATNPSEQPPQFGFLLEGMGGACKALEVAMAELDEESICAIGEALAGLCRTKGDIFDNCWSSLFEATVSVCSPSNDMGDTAKCVMLEMAIGLLTSYSAIPFCSNEMSRESFIRLCIDLMSRVEISDDGSSPESPYNVTRPPESDSGFGDEDGDEDALSEFAGYCLEKLFKACPIQESLRISCGAVFTLLQETNIGYIRTGLVITSILYDTLGAEMQEHADMVLGQVLRFASHDSARIRFCAFRCCKSMILSEGQGQNGDGEEEDDEGGGESSESMGFAVKFHGKYIPVALKAVKDNFTFPRVEYAVLNSLRAFFDPQKCPPQVVKSSSGKALALILDVHATSGYPLFVLEEAVSLVGNVSLLCPHRVVAQSYGAIIDHLKSVISADSAEAFNDSSYNVSRYKGKCLECAALLGRAVGLDVFHQDAVALLQEMVNAHERGLDYSEPMASYIVQTCARIAGVLGEEFRSYVESFIPPLLAHISEDIHHEIYTEENMHTAAGSCVEEGVEEFTLYRRGVGQVKVVHRTYESTEKEMSCRALYQYLLDIPKLVYEYAPSIVAAATTVASVCLNDNMYLILGTLISDSLKLYMRYCEANEHSVRNVVDMTSAALVSLLGMHDHVNSTATGVEYVESAQLIFDSVRETLKAVTDGRQSLAGWDGGLFIDADIVSAVARRIVLEANQWIVRNYSFGEEALSSSNMENEEELWLSLSDAAGWLLKAFPTAETATMFSSEMAVFLTGLLSASSDATPLLSMGISVLTDAVDSIPVDCLHIGGTGTEAGALIPILTEKLFELMAIPELTADSIYGLGVCAMHGGVGFDMFADHAIAAVGSVVAKTSDLEEDEEDNLRVRFAALGAALKLAVFKGHAMEAPPTAVLTSCLSMFPMEGFGFESTDAHDVFIDLLCMGDRRLLGRQFELLPQCLLIAAQLQSGFELAAEEISSSDAGIAEEDEFWESQSVKRTFGIKFEALVNRLPENVDMTVLRSAVNHLPGEAQSMFSSWQ